MHNYTIQMNNYTLEMSQLYIVTIQINEHLYNTNEQL